MIAQVSNDSSHQPSLWADLLDKLVLPTCLKRDEISKAIIFGSAWAKRIQQALQRETVFLLVLRLWPMLKDPGS